MNEARLEHSAEKSVLEPWHATQVDEVLRRVGFSHGGLSSAEHARRLPEHGPNWLPQAPSRGPLVRFLAPVPQHLHQDLVAGSY